MKVIINKCYGGFNLSETALRRYCELTGEEVKYAYKIPRNDPALVRVVEEMGARADGNCSELLVVEVPDNVKWYVEEYDGLEHIAEEHRTWG